MRLFQVSVSKGLHGSVVALPSPEQRRLSRQRVNAQRSESVGGQGPARKCGCPTITVTDEVLEQQRLSRQRVNAQRSAIQSSAVGVVFLWLRISIIPGSQTEKRAEEGAKRVAEEVEKYDPINDPNISEDPYKTLLIARVNYETTESRIKREFEAYGPIKRVRLVAHKEKNKPRAYAFIEYMHTRDMKGS